MRDLILGLDRLRCPQILTQIATFMLRYLDVLAGEARRMRVARLSRGDDPRFLWQLRGFAAGVGALFLRAFERGERVYLAMLSRGYDGRMPAVWQSAGAATARALGRRRRGAGRRRRHRRRRTGAVMIGAVETAPSLDVRGVRYAYPDGHVALHGVDLTVPKGERVALLGPERRRQDHAGAAPQRDPHRGARARSPSAA